MRSKTSENEVSMWNEQMWQCESIWKKKEMWWKTSGNDREKVIKIVKGALQTYYWKQCKWLSLKEVCSSLYSLLKIKIGEIIKKIK